MMCNAFGAAGDAVEQWDTSHLYASGLYTAIALKLSSQTQAACLPVISVFPVCPGWSGHLGEMKQCFARDSSRSCPLPRKFPHWVLLCNGRI